MLAHCFRCLPNRCRWLIGLAALCFAAGSQAASAAEEAPSYARDVMAVLSKAGCNQGACHGNQNGKGGFKLSLRGEDAQFDYHALVREQLGRRVDQANPDQSLILLKATAQIAHAGGRRFARDSNEYALLRDWIAQGAKSDLATAAKVERLEVAPREKILIAPEDELPVRAVAHFSDGSHREVTKLAVFEPSNQFATVDGAGVVHRKSDGEVTVLVRYLNAQVPVRLAFVPDREAPAWPHVPAVNYIDELVFAKLRTLRMAPSERCSDEVFLRRAYLDLVGILPTPEEARDFVADTRPQKREELIDQLLERPEFAEHWALKWSDLLRNEEKQLDEKGVQNFHAWIRRAIAEGKPLDEFARELLTTQGSTYRHPQANFYRANRDPITRAEGVAQLFLGVRLGCAKCHNHPFDRWTQDDYYGWAAVFAGVKYKILENRRRDDNDGHEFDGEQVVWFDPAATLKDPRDGEAVAPRLLNTSLDPDAEDQPPLDQLAAWLTSAEDHLFARAQANRIWFHLMGRGIVDPIDDFRATNPPSNPALLEALANDFRDSGYDLRHLIRTVMRSQVYQRSSAPNESNRADESNFARAYVRRLTAEQLADGLHQVVDVPPEYSGYPAGIRAGQLPGVVGARSRRGRLGRVDPFLKLFGKPPRLLVCECERTNDTTIGQAFQLISGDRINQLLTAPENRLSRLLSAGLTNGEIVDELYWAALTRPPSAEERAYAVEQLSTTSERRATLEDLTWALLNAKEFILRQ